MKIEQIEAKVLESIEQLYTYDFSLIKNNLNERTITHKLAEYLQKRFAEYNVDCEYNRDVTQSENHAKTIDIEKALRDELNNCKSDNKVELIQKEVSTYPDIIIHRRESNDCNILIIEAKKSNNNIDKSFDLKKLKAFTFQNGRYRFDYGLFIEFKIKDEIIMPKLVWFQNGQEMNQL